MRVSEIRVKQIRVNQGLVVNMFRNSVLVQKLEKITKKREI